MKATQQNSIVKNFTDFEDNLKETIKKLYNKITTSITVDRMNDNYKVVRVYNPGKDVHKGLIEIGECVEISFIDHSTEKIRVEDWKVPASLVVTEYTEFMRKLYRIGDNGTLILILQNLDTLIINDVDGYPYTNRIIFRLDFGENYILKMIND